MELEPVKLEKWPTLPGLTQIGSSRPHSDSCPGLISPTRRPPAASHPRFLPDGFLIDKDLLCRPSVGHTLLPGTVVSHQSVHVSFQARLPLQTVRRTVVKPQCEPSFVMSLTVTQKCFSASLCLISFSC